MSARSVGLIAVAGLVIAIGTSPNPAHPQPIDHAYKGSLECEEMPAGNRIPRTSLTMTVRNGSVMAMFDIDGLMTAAPATGPINATGVFHFGHRIFIRDAEVFHGEYNGTLNGAGGTLTGTQVLTRPTDRGSVTRTCTGTVFEVGSPKQ
jgi:hypothetical protein